MRLSAVNSALFDDKMFVVHVLPRFLAEDTRHSRTMSLTSKWQNNNLFSLCCNDDISEVVQTPVGKITLHFWLIRLGLLT